MVSMPAQLGVPFAPGSMLGRYELLATIGAGGMASVVLARQRGPAGFEKVVVVKLVHPHLAQDPAAVNMLLDEARVAAQIDHPNVVHTYELGEADGTFYIVMEYLAGESLARVHEEARTQNIQLAPLLAGKIVADAAEGLHFAHELCDFHGNHLGIVHRDVSPGNIVVQYNGTVKVVDFGIAKAHGRVTSTQDGELKGKYGYMAPEQIKNEPMDRRSDVFSLGVVLWEALTQRRLFNADNVAATLMQILTADRVPPSHFFPAIPHALDVACLRALAPDPSDRFQSAADMKQAIDDAVWQARISARDVEQVMAGLFAQRMQTQRHLLARATRDSLSHGDLEVLGMAFRKSAIAVSTALSSESVMHPPVSARPGGYDVSGYAVMSAPSLGYPIARPQVADLPYRVLQFEPRQRSATRSKRINVPMVILVAAVVMGVSATLFLQLRKQPHTARPEGTTVRIPVLDPNRMPNLAKPAMQPPSPKPPVVTQTPKLGSPPVAVESPTPTAPVVAETPKSRLPKRSKSVPPTRAKVETLTKRASEAYLSGEFRAAETGYKQAIASNKGYAPAYRGLGFVYQRTGKTKQAIDALETYVRLAPNARDVAAVERKIAQMGGS